MFPTVKVVGGNANPYNNIPMSNPNQYLTNLEVRLDLTTALLERLVEQFDTSGAVYTISVDTTDYSGGSGDVYDDLPVDNDCAQILDESLELLYNTDGVIRTGDNDDGPYED